MSEDKPPPAESFEDRLTAARRRQGLDALPTTGNGPGARVTGANAMSVGLRVGVEMVSALAVAVAIGWWLDRWLHTMPLFLCVFVLLGGGAGIANVWRLMAPGGKPRGGNE
jgi:ATP synthase protein I